MFIVALYLTWCGYLHELSGVTPQLYADNLKCVRSDPWQLLRAAQFTSAYVRLVGQESAPSKCILLSTSVAVCGVDRWSVKVDVRDVDDHLDTTYRACDNVSPKTVTGKAAVASDFS